MDGSAVAALIGGMLTFLLWVIIPFALRWRYGLTYRQAIMVVMLFPPLWLARTLHLPLDE